MIHLSPCNDSTNKLLSAITTDHYSDVIMSLPNSYQHHSTNTFHYYYLRFLISATFSLFGIVTITATKVKMVKKVQYYYKYATKKQEGTTTFLFHHLNYFTLLWSQLSLSTFLGIPPLSLCCTY